MKQIKSVCVGCKFAQWQKTKDGRVNSNQSGQCTKTVALPSLPLSFFDGAFTQRDIERIAKNLQNPRRIWYTSVIESKCETRESL